MGFRVLWGLGFLGFGVLRCFGFSGFLNLGGGGGGVVGGVRVQTSDEMSRASAAKASCDEESVVYT